MVENAFGVGQPRPARVRACGRSHRHALVERLRKQPKPVGRHDGGRPDAERQHRAGHQRAVEHLDDASDVGEQHDDGDHRHAARMPAQ